jgi:RHS repeat-associated protein
MLSTAEADPTPWLPLPDLDDWVDGEAAAGTDRTNNYYRARYYDPKIGRFLSEDPLGPGRIFGSDRARVNLYWYADANPVNFYDPDGRDPESVLCRTNPLACGRGALCARQAAQATQAKFGYDRDNTPANAFKHCYWMCCTTRQTNPGFAHNLGIAHEGGPGASSPANRMDIYNNEQGICRAAQQPGESCEKICSDAPLRCDPCNGPRQNR